MHPIARRINDNRICLTSFCREFLCEILDFRIHEFDICDTISVRIFLSIRARIGNKLDRVDFFEVFREENPDSSSSRIEIQEHSSLILYRVDHLGIELLSTEGVHLEE